VRAVLLQREAAVVALDARPLPLPRVFIDAAVIMRERDARSSVT
jgi:hypothetical protein